jgi:HPt (histidine-containing phosphotransfer) domain-containing protein
MTPLKDTARMQQLAKMVLDAELGLLKRAADQRDQTKSQIAGLRPAETLLDDKHGISGALAALRYQAWADARRIELQQVLAKQTAHWLDTRDKARLAFGKAEGFNQIAAKLSAGKPKVP